MKFAAKRNGTFFIQEITTIHLAKKRAASDYETALFIISKNIILA
jgi:hypothetical protein